MRVGGLARSWVAVVVAVAAMAGCAVGRHGRLERDVARLEQELVELQKRVDAHSLQTESIAVGLDKQRARVDRVLPPTAQWLKLVPGETIQWYVGDETGTLYVQCVAAPSGPGAARVVVMTDEATMEWSPLVGESREYAWKSGRDTGVVVTFHGALTRADGTVYGLFSISTAVELELP